MIFLHDDQDLSELIQATVDHALSDQCDLTRPFWRDMRAFLLNAMGHGASDAPLDMPLDLSVAAAVDHEIAREEQAGQSPIVQPKGDGE